MRKIIIVILGIIGILGILSLVPKKGEIKNDQSVNLDSSSISITEESVQKVEVFLFHRTQRCITCITIGKLCSKTIEERFSSEVSSDKVVFLEVNIDDPENKALAEKYQASGSSLFINAIKDGSDNIEEDINVWRLSGNEEAFKNYLTDKINSLLNKQ